MFPLNRLSLTDWLTLVVVRLLLKMSLVLMICWLSYQVTIIIKKRKVEFKLSSSNYLLVQLLSTSILLVSVQ